MSTTSTTPARHPGIQHYLDQRATDVQARVADSITAFAGSMAFVYLHVVVFTVWMVLGEGTPWPTLTLAVSLEAIFLSTFVMVSQNRQAARSDLRASIDFENNLRSEIWAIHMGQALGVDVNHVEEIVQKALEAVKAREKE